MLRGKWLVDNLFGWRVPPPPPGVDTDLEATRGEIPASMRERLAAHRRNPSCANCHAVIDPIGFALENFDVIGGWREVDDEGRPIDATGTTAAGIPVAGLPGLRALLLEDQAQFPRTVTAKLLAYALGRRLEYYDQPVVRQIVRERGGGRVPLVGNHCRHRAERAVHDAGAAERGGAVKPVGGPPSGRPGGGRHDSAQGTVAATHGTQGDRRHACAAVSRCDGAGGCRQARRGSPGAAFPGLLRAERHGHGLLDAGHYGADYDLPPVLEPLAAVRDQMTVLSGLRAN